MASHQTADRATECTIDLADARRRFWMGELEAPDLVACGRGFVIRFNCRLSARNGGVLFSLPDKLFAGLAAP